MPFFLDGNPTQGEISEAVNYLLSNFTQNVSADPATGQITGPTGEGVGYLYKYMDVKYADSFDGTLNFSDTPTNRGYYGLRNNDSSVESTDPADYVWYKVTGGFGVSKFLYYLTTGGRQIQFAVSTSVPNAGWIQDSGAAIDLDITTRTNAVANFVVIRVANSSAAPTDSECISAIGRTPISGDICTVNYNSGIYSITYKYTTGWAIFQKYITGDLIVANSITATNIAANTITADKMNVTQLSAIAANMGTITAGDLSVGSSPAISGTTMTGVGAHLYNTGNFAFGNSTTNLVFNGSQVYLNGFANATTAVSSGTPNVPSTPTTIMTFTVSKQVPLILGVTGSINTYLDGPAFTPTYCNFTLLFQVYDSTGTIVTNANVGANTSTFPFNWQLTGMPSMRYGLEQSYGSSILINLPVGTYTLRVSGISAFYSSTGTNSLATYYQGSYKAFVYQATI